MAYTTINKSTDYFNTKLYTGNGSTNAITGVGFQPDLIWIKERSSTSSHNLVDAVRGVTKRISSDSTNAEETLSGIVSSFDSDGFTNGADNGVNENSQTYASWNWKANGQGSSNSDGSINSTVSANTTAGFSIVKWTGTGANATVGHGLGQALDMVIVKNRDDSDDWITWHNALAGSEFIRLNLNNAKATGATRWNSTIPTSSVFSLGSSNGSNGNGDDMIAYCFAEKTGFSKFGSYTGIDASDNTFVYCGFAPSWIMFKRTDSANSWGIFDNKRDALNPNQAVLDAENNNAESSGADVDFLSNGFKIRSASGLNGDGQYIYMAFGQSIVGSNNVPATAR